jgi:mannan endo-1,4-beta-mannosidase
LATSVEIGRGARMLLLGFAAATIIWLAAPSAQASPAARRGPPVAVGAFIHNSYQYPGLYDQYARKVGRRPVILGSYRGWSYRLIDTDQVGQIWRRGAVPMITWEPIDFRNRPYLLRKIARGRYDGYLRRSARAARAWHRPLVIRFAHEMNGDWYPWGVRRNGNTPSAYIGAWRRVVRIFRSVGARNVRWVWCPSQNGSGRFPFKQFYPGDHWVNFLCLDGFNWSLSPRWQSFSRVFASSYNTLVRMSSRPIIIAETGSWEKGGSKARWVSRAFRRQLPRFNHIRAVAIYSVDDPRGDLRVNSSRPALRAFRSAVALPKYSVTRKEFLSTPARLRGRDTVAVPPAHLRRPSLFDRATDKAGYVWLFIALTAAALVLLAIATMRMRKAKRAGMARE